MDFFGSQYLQGPVLIRKKKDKIFLAVFTLSFIVFILLAWQSIQVGDLQRLSYQQDSNGNQCRQSLDASLYSYNRKYLYVFNPNETNSESVCVSKCPSIQSINNTQVCSTLTVYSNDSLYQQPLSYEKCNQLIYDSLAIGDTCFPSNLSQINQNQSDHLNGIISQNLNQKDYLQIAFGDFAILWPWIFAAVGGAMIVSFLFLISLKYYPNYFIWPILYFNLLILNGGVVFLAFQWYQTIEQYQSAVTSFGVHIDYYAYLISLILLSLAVITINIYFIRYLFKIKYVIVILKEVFKVISQVKGLYFLTIISCLAVIINFGFWVYLQLNLFSGSVDPFIYTFTYDLSILKYLDIIILVVSFWIQQSILGFFISALAGFVSSQYWGSSDHKSFKGFRKLIQRTLKFSLGSIFAISILRYVMILLKPFYLCFKFMRFVSNSVQNKQQNFVNDEDLESVKPLKRFVDFHDESYIILALNGFCAKKSSIEAQSILERNQYRIQNLISYMNYYTSVLKLSLSIGGASLMLILIQYFYGEDKPRCSSSIFLFSFYLIYQTINVVISLIILSFKTILINSCRDLERIDVSVESPLMVSETIQHLMNINLNEQTKGNQIGIVTQQFKIEKTLEC